MAKNSVISNVSCHKTVLYTRVQRGRACHLPEEPQLEQPHFLLSAAYRNNDCLRLLSCLWHQVQHHNTFSSSLDCLGSTFLPPPVKMVCAAEAQLMLAVVKHEMYGAVCSLQ